MAATNAAKAAAAKNEVISDAVEIVEDVKDIVEDSVELVKISWIRRNPQVVLLGVGLGAAVSGAAITYLVVSKRLQKKWQKLAEEQIDSVKSEYRALKKEGPEFDLATLAAGYDTTSDDVVVRGGSIDTTKPVRTDYHKIALDPEVAKDIPTPVNQLPERPVPDAVTVVTETMHQNIFQTNNPSGQFNWDKELAYREDNPTEVHVITKDEYDANESDFDQLHLTYFDGDGVLTGDMDQPVSDSNALVGDHNMGRFGDGSEDPEIVYIRNPRLQLDIEVVKSKLSYTKAVLAIDEDSTTELRHSQRSRRDRLRD